MITTEEKREIVSSLSGEAQNFSIEASGKAFRTLIDNLYSNKIQSIVRELCSNAYDAHAEGGNPEEPFEIVIPALLDPTFSVRDYGISMPHEFVMKFYSTLFYSPKETSNQVVGRYGLGSKSPFAYTDSFNVTTYIDGVQNTYICHIDDKDIPTITHQSTKETTERNGTKVSMAASTKDAQEFTAAVQRMLVGYSVMPKVINAPEGLTKPEPLAEVNGFRRYKTPNAWSDADTWFYNQGGVLYPMAHHEELQKFFHINQAANRTYHYSGKWRAEYLYVLDMPIGTFDVTPSREAIDLNPTSIASIQKFIHGFIEKIKAELVDAYDEVKSRPGLQEVYNRYNIADVETFAVPIPNDKFNLGLKSNMVWIQPDHILKNRTLVALNKGIIGSPSVNNISSIGFGWEVDGGVSKTEPGRAYYYDRGKIHELHKVPTGRLGELKLYVGMERKIDRRAFRMRQFKGWDKAIFCFTEDLPRLARILQLKSSQIHPIESMPDVAPPMKGGSRPTAMVNLTGTMVVTPSNYYWLEVSRGYVKSKELNRGYFGTATWTSRVKGFLAWYDKQFKTDLSTEFDQMQIVQVIPSKVDKMDPQLNVYNWFKDNIELDKVGKVYPDTAVLNTDPTRWVNNRLRQAPFNVQDYNVHNLMSLIGTMIIRTEVPAMKAGQTNLPTLDFWEALVKHVDKQSTQKDGIEKKLEAALKKYDIMLERDKDKIARHMMEYSK